MGEQKAPPKSKLKTLIYTLVAVLLLQFLLSGLNLTVYETLEGVQFSEDDLQNTTPISLQVEGTYRWKPLGKDEMQLTLSSPALGEQGLKMHILSPLGSVYGSADSTETYTLYGTYRPTPILADRGLILALEQEGMMQYFVCPATDSDSALQTLHRYATPLHKTLTA